MPGSVTSPAETPARVLIVEDEPAHAEAICRAFYEAAAQTETRVVRSIREYREAVATAVPALAIIDLVLPDGRAESLLTSPPEQAAFPIVVMTSHGDEAIAVAAIRAGALDYVVKSPEAFEQMPHTVARALRAWRLLMERKATQASLRESEDRFRSLFSAMTEIVALHELVLGVDGKPVDYRLLDCNSAFTAITGVGREQAIGALASKLYGTREAPYLETYARVAQTGQPSQFEAFFPPLQKHFFVSVFSPAPGRFATVASDITGRKEAEAALRESQGRYRLLVEDSPDIVGVYQDKRLVFINSAGVRLLGAGSPADLLNREIEQIIHPDDVVDAIRRVQRRMAGESGLYPAECRYLRRDGSILPVEVSVAVISFAGRPALQFVARDISERKRAHEALEQEVTFRKSVIERAAEGLCVCHDIPEFPHLRFTLWNERMTQITGYSMGEINRLGWYQTVYPDPAYRQQAADRINQMRAGKDLIGEEWEVTRADGQTRTLAISTTVLSHKEGACHVLALMSDNTDRKRAETALRTSEERFRTLIEKSAEGLALFGTDGTILYQSPSLFAIQGYAPTERDGRSGFELVHPDDLAATMAVFEKLRATPGASAEFAARLRHKNGSWRWHEATVTNHLEDPAIRAFVLNYRDITGRMQAESALRESEKRFATTFRASPMAIAISRLRDGHFVDVNAAFVKLYGYPRKEVIGRTSQELRLWPGWDRAGATGRLQQAKRLQNLEYQGRCKTGEIRDLLASLELIEVGGEACILGIAADITERKQAERTGRVQHDLAVTLAGTSSLAEGLRLCLAAAIEASGLDSGGFYLLNEETGRLDFHPTNRGLSRAFVQSVLHYDADSAHARLVRAGRPVYMRYAEMGLPLSEVERAEGLRFLAVIPLWLKGRIIGCLNVASHTQDDLPSAQRQALEMIAAEATAAITRLKAEEQLRYHGEQLRALTRHLEELREDERTRMAREVHDVLGQLLTAVKMDIAWWERRFGQLTDPGLRAELGEKAQETNRLADRMIETVQKIARELRPSVLDNIGLGAALQFEARQFQERTGTTCHVTVPPDTLPLDPEQATAMFRVFQELLTNVARHAQATRVTAVLRQEKDQVILEVKDNGRGIRAEEVEGAHSLGLLGMTERASLQGGSFRISGQPGRGTVACLTVPTKPALTKKRCE
jgi:PAS domain S-box-containing protein